MLALDTNVLVRLLYVDDTPEQAERAARFIRECLSLGEIVLLPTTAIVEAVWVWMRRYKLCKSTIMAFLEMIQRVEPFVLGDEFAINGALRAWSHGNGDFADYVIQAEALRDGATQVVTYDSILHAEAGFLPP